MFFRESVATGVLCLFVTAFAFTGVAHADNPAFRSSPAAFNFGDITFGQQYSTGSDYLTLHVTSEAEVEITSISITGDDAGLFGFSDEGCVDTPLGQDGECWVDLEFTPDTVGQKQATLAIDSNATAGTKLIPLSGNAVEPTLNSPSFLAPVESDARPDLSGAYNTSGLGTADFNGDGLADVATNTSNDPQVAVAFGQGDGTLTNPVAYPTGGSTTGNLVTGDFDGINGPDIVSLSGSAFSGQANILLNDGNGVFTSADPVPAHSGDGFISPGDFNEDGHLDFTVTGNELMEIFLGDGNGTFAKAGEQPTDVEGSGAMGATTRIADFRGDGSNDVAITDWDGKVEIYLSDGDGTFTMGPIVKLNPCGCAEPWGISPADLNGDGRDDLSVAVFYESQYATLIAQPGGGMAVTQLNRIPFSPDGYDTNPKIVTNGDLNGDGVPELVSADYNGDSITVNSGLSSGEGFLFAEHLSMPGVAESRYIAPSQVAVDDFNGDGRGDVIVGSDDLKNVLFINDGQPNSAANPTSLDFGEVVAGTTSAVKSVQVANRDGLAPLKVEGLSIAGDDSSEFTIVDDSECRGGPVLVGDSCPVKIGFRPVGTGSRSAELKISTNAAAPGDELVIAIAGNSVAPTFAVSATPSSVDFGQVTLGQSSPALNVTLKNTGNSPLKIGRIALEGAGSTDFTLGSGCASTTLAPGETCTVPAVFSPLAAGPNTASIRITTNSSQGPLLIPLAGTGIAKPTPPPTAPKVTFKKKPKKKYVIKAKRLKKVKVAFKSNQAGSKFQCRIDRKKFTRCKSPKVFKKIKPGKHVIKVRATKSGKTGPAKAVKFKVIRKK